jgi:hypothetical protein
MGSLDDAIREHLELKRQRGASDEEVKRQEEEAFGRGRRPVPEEAPAAEPTAEDLPDQLPEPQGIEAAEPQSNGQPAEPVDAAAALEPEPFDPDEVPADESLQPEVTVRDAREEPPIDWADTEGDEAEDEPADEADEPGDDPLRDTPDFLEGSPEEDRLWFEQRPPKDFDLD